MMSNRRPRIGSASAGTPARWQSKLSPSYNKKCASGCRRRPNSMASRLKSTHQYRLGSIVQFGSSRILPALDRKSTRLNYSHVANSYAVSYLKKKSDQIDTNVLRPEPRSPQQL